MQKLTLQPKHPVVETTAEQHGPVAALQVARRELRRQGFVEPAVGVRNGQVLDRELGLDRDARHGSRP